MDRRGFLTVVGAGLGAGVRLDATVDGRAAAQGATVTRPLTPPATGLIQVACAISRGTTEIDFVGPQAVFQTWHRDPVTRKPSPKFQLWTVSDTRDPVDGRIADYTFDTAPAAHVVVVPAQRGSEALLNYLRKVSKTADVTMSVCVGARHLALAGLLDGLSATTHHGSLAAFTKEFTSVKWVSGLRFMEGDKISTSGGLTSGIDLALRVVERYFGRTAAQDVADHLEYESKRWIV